MKLTVQQKREIIDEVEIDGLSFLLLQHTRFGGECG